jgi:hypothetical protein
MPALPADIGAASRDVVTATWSDAVIAARYPASRDGGANPAEGYFDSVNDATTVVGARASLIGIERRRFTAVAADLVWPAVSTGLPQVFLTDAEQSVSNVFLAARLEIDLEAETSTFELFG